MKKTLKTSGLILIILSIFLFLSCKKEKPAPPVVTTTAAIEISYTTAASGGNVTSEGGATVISRGICWNTAADPTIANSIKSETGTTGSFTSNLTQLTPNTKYYLKAFATNAGGTAYGDQVTFTTVAISTPVLTTTEITSITQTTATSGGNITDEKGGSVTARGVCWSTTENPTTSGNKTSDGIGSGIFASSITGLIGNTIYYLRAYATNSAGTQYGNQVTFKTSPLIPSLTTSDISSVTVTSCNAGGNISSDGGATVTIRGVCWSTSPDPTISDSKTDNGNGTGIFTSSITSLTGGTTYYLRAYATNSAGTAYGNQLSATTNVIDFDGNVYHALTIGTQIWMAENLKVSHYRNGDAIPNVESGSTWITLTTGAYCFYNNDTYYSTVYGNLYNGYVVLDTRGVCPYGWHIPGSADFSELQTSIGGLMNGGKLKETGTTHWTSPNTGATNETGFNALPSGLRMGDGFAEIDISTSFWQNDISSATSYFWGLNNYSSAFVRNSYTYPNTDALIFGFSIRCIKN